jgi:hypothetical protein
VPFLPLFREHPLKKPVVTWLFWGCRNVASAKGRSQSSSRSDGFVEPARSSMGVAGATGTGPPLRPGKDTFCPSSSLTGLPDTARPPTDRQGPSGLRTCNSRCMFAGVTTGQNGSGRQVICFPISAQKKGGTLVPPSSSLVFAVRLSCRDRSRRGGSGVRERQVPSARADRGSSCPGSRCLNRPCLRGPSRP